MLDNKHNQKIIEELDQAVSDFEINELLNPDSDYSAALSEHIKELKESLND